MGQVSLAYILWAKNAMQALNDLDWNKIRLHLKAKVSRHLLDEQTINSVYSSSIHSSNAKSSIYKFSEKCQLISRIEVPYWNGNMICLFFSKRKKSFFNHCNQRNKGSASRKWHGIFGDSMPDASTDSLLLSWEQILPRPGIRVIKST